MNTKLQSVDDAAIAGVEASETEATATTITKPGAFTLDRFKTKRAAAIANVETLLTALPHYSIAQAKDFVRLHPNEDEYWSPELCFVNVPIKGQKNDTLHLIDEELAVRHLPSAKIQRFRLALATKPYDIFFLCPRPDTQRRQPVERDQPRGLRAGKGAMGAGVEPSRGERRRLQDRLCARPRGVPATEVADAAARRTDRANLRRPHDR